MLNCGVEKFFETPYVFGIEKFFFIYLNTFEL